MTSVINLKNTRRSFAMNHTQISASSGISPPWAVKLTATVTSQKTHFHLTHTLMNVICTISKNAKQPLQLCVGDSRCPLRPSDTRLITHTRDGVCVCVAFHACTASEHTDEMLRFQWGESCSTHRPSFTQWHKGIRRSKSQPAQSATYFIPPWASQSFFFI